MPTRQNSLEALAKAKEWFDLAKYEPFRAFTQQQWGQQIARRHFLLVASAKDRDGPTDMEVLSRMVPEVMEAPCSDWPYSSSRIPIRQLNRGDLARLASLAESLPGNESDLVDHLFGDVGPGQGWFGHLLIDLGAGKEDLIARFSKWVSERQHLIVTNPPKSNAFDRLRASKVLPYVDLVAWSVLTGNHLREEDYVALLGVSSSSADFRYQYRKIVRNTKTYINLTVANSLLMGCAS